MTTEVKTKQEEIREGIKTCLNMCKSVEWTDADMARGILIYLKSVGVVIKVKRGHDSDCATHNEPAYLNGECGCVTLPVGCVAVEELI